MNAQDRLLGLLAAEWIEKESSAVTGKAKSYVPVVVVGLGPLVVVVVAVRKTVVG